MVRCTTKPIFSINWWYCSMKENRFWNHIQNLKLNFLVQIWHGYSFIRIYTDIYTWLFSIVGYSVFIYPAQRSLCNPDVLMEAYHLDAKDVSWIHRKRTTMAVSSLGWHYIVIEALLWWLEIHWKTICSKILTFTITTFLW